MSIMKYPRTAHVQGSKFQHGDSDMDAIPFSELEEKHLIIEEKIDGANCGISFEDGKLMLQSRGHYLRGGPREKQFELLKQWAATHEVALYDLLGDRYVMYGEWMFACHTIWYDQLPHYFMEFDVFDKETGKFLSTVARDVLLRHGRAGVEIIPVRVLAVGVVGSVSELQSMVGQSAFISEDPRKTFYEQALTDKLLPNDPGTILLPSVSAYYGKLHTSLWLKYYVGPTMEGLYIKHEENGEVKGRYKFVRGDFTSHVAGQEEHWHDRPILQNQLASGAMERMFSVTG